MTRTRPQAEPATNYQLRATSKKSAGDPEFDAAVPSRSLSEFELLRFCAAVELNAERTARIASTVDGIDWQKFLGLADHHGVLPLVSKNLLAHAPGLPEQVARSLQSAYETNIRRSLWFAGELVRIATHFEQESIRSVPYKGPILAESAYGDLALRNFSDLDFLIAPEDFAPARRALEKIGYRPSQEYAAKVENYWLRAGYERAFDGPAGKYLVELQWRVLPRFYAVELPTRELLERAAVTSVAGSSVSTLLPEDLLLVLCLHAAKHLWMRLIWIADIAETMRTQNIDYTLVASRARALGIARILAVSFRLARDVLGATIPSAAEEVLVPDPPAQVLGELFADRLRRSASYDFESSEYFRLILRLRERRQNRWRYLCRLVWKPGEGDLEAVRLPEGLFPLYRLVRVGRLARKLL